MYKFDDYLDKGYSIEQINQILKANDVMREYLLYLNPKVPESIFRKIRQKNIRSILLMNKINIMSEEELSLIKDNDKFFDDFILSETDPYIGINPIMKEPFTHHAHTIIIGTPGTGKSFYDKILKLKYENN